ncbi:hypothetical protein SDC9_136491 [bioreactor metagenome]|uniref:DRTGG domain-containing protein n=1 Tax=bioreactor metagenome TaxID=1076179 RepID=A0A645DLF1_9ZZZZ|nr:hypothetical protein [Lachnospiraceae bacterium]
MTLSDVVKLLKAKVMTENADLSAECYRACGADLMSDVLAFSKDKSILLTGLMNIQVVRTAEMMDIKTIIFVRGKIATPEIISLAKEMEITILCTDYPLYEACGILYSKGLGNVEE